MRWTRAFTPVLLCVLGLLLGGAPGALATSKSNAERAKPIFWQIDAPTRDGQPKAGRLYLLGSIHVGPVGGWQLPRGILDRFDAATALIVEVDMRGGSAEKQDGLVRQRAMLPDGRSLKHFISPRLYRTLARHLRKTNRNLANINIWRPWMVATMLLTFELERLGYPTEAGLDLDMMARVGPHQRVIALETMEEQLNSLSSMSRSNQELMLRDMLLQMDDVEKYFEEMKEAWRLGDAAKLQEVLFRELEATPELAPFYEHLIYDRNESMCKRLEEHLAGGETLFGVVGAYHLVGSRGIPACLAKRGFTVKRLPEPKPAGR